MTPRIEAYARWLDEGDAEGLRSLAASGIDDIRTLNCAVNNGIRSLEDFAALTERQLLQWPNFGRKSLAIVQAALETKGLALGSEDVGDECLKSLIAEARKTRAELRAAGERHKEALEAIRIRRQQLGLTP